MRAGQRREGVALSSNDGERGGGRRPKSGGGRRGGRARRTDGPAPTTTAAPGPARPSQRGEMAAGGGLNIQMLLEAAEYLERRERGAGYTPPGLLFPPHPLPLRWARR